LWGEFQEQEEQQYLCLCTHAYKLFSDGKTLVEVDIALKLRESKATKFCRVLEAKTIKGSKFCLWGD
jgi:hypothetical protein